MTVRDRTRRRAYSPASRPVPIPWRSAGKSPSPATNAGTTALSSTSSKPAASKRRRDRAAPKPPYPRMWMFSVAAKFQPRMPAAPNTVCLPSTEARPEETVGGRPRLVNSVRKRPSSFAAQSPEPCTPAKTCRSPGSRTVRSRRSSVMRPARAAPVLRLRLLGVMVSVLTASTISVPVPPTSTVSSPIANAAPAPNSNRRLGSSAMATRGASKLNARNTAIIGTENLIGSNLPCAHGPGCRYVPGRFQRSRTWMRWPLISGAPCIARPMWCRRDGAQPSCPRPAGGLASQAHSALLR